MEKDIYLKLEIELSKANQSCWTISQILSLRSDDLKELGGLLETEKEKFNKSLSEIQKLYTYLSENF
jgi:hypothetical protein